MWPSQCHSPCTDEELHLLRLDVLDVPRGQGPVQRLERLLSKEAQDHGGNLDPTDDARHHRLQQGLGIVFGNRAYDWMEPSHPSSTDLEGRHGVSTATNPNAGEGLLQQVGQLHEGLQVVRIGRRPSLDAMASTAGAGGKRVGLGPTATPAQVALRHAVRQ